MVWREVLEEAENDDDVPVTVDEADDDVEVDGLPMVVCI